MRRSQRKLGGLGGNFTYDEIAAELRVSRARVQQIERTALEKLKRRIQRSFQELCP